MSTSPKSSSTLKRPAPPTRDSSSSIQAISPQKPNPNPTSVLRPKPEEKEKQKDAEPPTKKAKIALVSGGAGSGGQTKLAFGKTGTGGQTRLNFGKTGSGSGPSASGSGSGLGGEKKTIMGGTGGSSSNGAGIGATTSLPPSLSTTSSSPMRTHLLLPIPSLPPNHTPTQLSSHITALRSIKADFIALLTEEQKGLLGMEMESMGDDWFVGLRGEFVKGYFLELKRFIIAEQGKNKVFPPVGDVYSWTRFCPLAGIRVVIIGQDPYHNDGQAHGLAFSVRKGTPVPPSLRNMYKELENEYDGFKAPKHGDLSSWARQGVLLLNTSLTVRAHEANSHSKRGWETFTEKVLKLIVDRLSEKGAEVGGKGVVFLAWGAGAGKLVKGISERQHHILTSAHPSPLSASRGFMGNDHFKKCNEWLERQYGEGKGIDWTSVSKEE